MQRLEGSTRRCQVGLVLGWVGARFDANPTDSLPDGQVHTVDSAVVISVLRRYLVLSLSLALALRSSVDPPLVKP
jgi:hypothetical protein